MCSAAVEGLELGLPPASYVPECVQRLVFAGSCVWQAGCDCIWYQKRLFLLLFLFASESTIRTEHLG
jgi:hypothetical protein